MSSGNAETQASGRFVIRLDPEMHAALRKAARELGVSLNEYCARKLEAPVGGAAFPSAAQAVRRAAGLFGEGLVGVVVFGSWARGELAERSDVDLLVVLESSVPLARDLYRAWDRDPLRWEDRPVEPHFAHLPESGGAVGGLWAEVALDGIVLFEKGFRVSSRLAQVRRDIVSGRMVRRMVHGHPYWTSGS